MKFSSRAAKWALALNLLVVAAAWFSVGHSLAGNPPVLVMPQFVVGVAASVVFGWGLTLERLRVPAVAVPPPREPRDKRPLLRGRADLDNPADPRLSVCPVCGMDGDEVTLDGTCMGAWPAHSECAEWLGDWKPSGIPPVPRKLPAEAQRIMGEIRDIGGDAALRQVEKQITMTFGIPFPVIADKPSDDELMQALHRGLIDINDARAALNREEERRFEIESVEKVREAAKAIRTSKRWCLCGTEFEGTSEQIRIQQAMHDQECRYKVHPGHCPCGQRISVAPATLEALFRTYRASGFCSLHGRS